MALSPDVKVAKIDDDMGDFLGATLIAGIEHPMALLDQIVECLSPVDCPFAMLTAVAVKRHAVEFP
jgi:hypothetical protein